MAQPPSRSSLLVDLTRTDIDPNLVLVEVAKLDAQLAHLVRRVLRIIGCFPVLQQLARTLLPMAGVAGGLAPSSALSWSDEALGPDLPAVLDALGGLPPDVHAQLRPELESLQRAARAYNVHIQELHELLDVCTNKLRHALNQDRYRPVVGLMTQLVEVCVPPEPAQDAAAADTVADDVDDDDADSDADADEPAAATAVEPPGRAVGTGRALRWYAASVSAVAAVALALLVWQWRDTDHREAPRQVQRDSMQQLESSAPAAAPAPARPTSVEPEMPVPVVAHDPQEVRDAGVLPAKRSLDDGFTRDVNPGNTRDDVPFHERINVSREVNTYPSSHDAAP